VAIFNQFLIDGRAAPEPALFARYETVDVVNLSATAFHPILQHRHSCIRQCPSRQNRIHERLRIRLRVVHFDTRLAEDRNEAMSQSENGADGLRARRRIPGIATPSALRILVKAYDTLMGR
jgi:hypothetical protein